MLKGCYIDIEVGGITMQARLLLVEDDSEIARVIRDTLTQGGYDLGDDGSRRLGGFSGSEL